MSLSSSVEPGDDDDDGTSVEASMHMIIAIGSCRHAMNDPV